MSENNTRRESTAPASMPALFGWRTWASMAIALSVLVILALRVDFAEVWREIRKADLCYALLGAVAHYLTYFVRGRRWKKCLAHLPLRASSMKFGLVVFFYNWVDNIVPAKLGDIYAAHMARINFGVKRSHALGSLVFLRMIDAWVVLLLAALSSWAVFSGRLPEFVGWSLLGGVIMALAATCVLITFIFLKKKTPRWVPERFQRMINDFREGMQPSREYFLEISFLTICIWTLETLWIYCLTLAFGLEFGPVTVIFLTTLSLLASIFPFTPSGAGAVEVTIFSCLRLVGVPVAVATSLTVLNRLIDYWLHILLGVLTFAIRKKFGLHTWREVPVSEEDLAEDFRGSLKFDPGEFCGGRRFELQNPGDPPETYLMALIGTVPRRAVNLPPGSLGTLIGKKLGGKIVLGPELQQYATEFAGYIGTTHAIFAASGRSAFQLALESLGLQPGQEIIFPAFTFPVMPMVAKLLGFEPVFCDADPDTYNSGPEHFAPLITEKTGAILATHLFGLPCRIAELAAITKERGIFLMEDCAHACGATVDGRKVGTFGDLAIFSFAEGKNMPCFGGGAIVTSDDGIAERAREILKTARVPDAGAAFKQGASTWVKWLVTRPLIFGLSVFPLLRLKLAMGKPLLDSAVGDELVAKFAGSDPKITNFVNLQAAIGLKQLKHIDAFNDGARANAKVLTDHLGEVPGVRPARSIAKEHIYVYYPIAVDADKRDDLRHHLLRHGIDTKTTDMADCAVLEPFREATEKRIDRVSPTEAALLEICVYPVIPQRKMRKIAKVIRSWAGLPEIKL